jgi:hypothetical protein
MTETMNTSVVMGDGVSVLSPPKIDEQMSSIGFEYSHTGKGR